MALQSSGAISLDDIHDEAGGTSGSTATINDSDIRGLIDKSAGASMAFNEWYGASAELSGDIGVFGHSIPDSSDTTTSDTGYVVITSTGNGSDFAQYETAYALIEQPAAGSSSTRGITAGGTGNDGAGNQVQPVLNYTYTTIRTQAQFADFGDMDVASYGHAAVCSSTRMVTMGGSTGTTKRLEYITIANTGNGTDFGDIQYSGRNNIGGGISNGTRGVYNGGQEYGVSATSNHIDYITIANTSNTADFGNLRSATATSSGSSNSTIGLIYRGTGANEVDKITIASTGNATGQGDMSTSRAFPSSTGNATRGLVVGGFNKKSIDYFTYASASDATDFGDLQNRAYQTPAFSTAHGGL